MIKVLPHRPDDPPGIWDWRNRLSTVEGYVGRLLMDRTIWRETQAMLDANPHFDHPPFLFNWMTLQYLGMQAIGIRRQMDAKEIYQETLGRLLLILENNADQLTRDWFLGMYPDNVKSSGNGDFDQFARPDENAARSEWFDETRKRLGEKVKPIRMLANRRVAHIDSREVEAPAIQEVDDAIDAIAEVTVQLALLLNATGLMSPEPVIQFDWTEGLEVPWNATSRENAIAEES